jgi:membrane-bound ClpP family serine protease
MPNIRVVAIIVTTIIIVPEIHSVGINLGEGIVGLCIVLGISMVDLILDFKSKSWI